MPENYGRQEIQFIVGDFNCHSTSWGYNKTDRNGQLLEEWAEVNNLSLLHDPKLPCSFNSKIWKRGYNPGNCLVSQKLQDSCVKHVYDALPKTQHRPIGVQAYSVIKTAGIPFRRRFNLKKANWSEYSANLDAESRSITRKLPNSMVLQICSRNKKSSPKG